jgi:8-oxo-dGTP pyrophosphatase MutT (NUDIX family)
MTEYLLKQLTAYLSFFPAERRKIHPLIAEIEIRTDILNRKTSPGHITASGIVVSKNRLLMIRHPGLGKWLQPGGHVENSETPLQAAIREVEEETGMPTTSHAWHRRQQFPVDIDIHRIAANERKSEPAHIHYDFRYMLEGSAPLTSGEHPAQWKEIAGVEEDGLVNVIKKINDLKIDED